MNQDLSQTCTLILEASMAVVNNITLLEWGRAGVGKGSSGEGQEWGKGNAEWHWETQV